MGKDTIIFQISAYILHPVFIPLYITILYINIFNEVLTATFTEYILYLIFTGTLVFPLITIFILLKTKLVNSIHLKTQKERILPIVFSGISIYITARLLMIGSINSPLNSYLIGIVVTLSWILIFSKRLKVSLHVASISAALGFNIYLSQVFLINLLPIIISLIIILGLVSTSRIKLNAHSYKEVVVGIIFGIVPQLGFTYLY